MATARKLRRPMFIASIAGISILANTAFGILADRLPWKGLKTLHAYNTRRNG